MKCSTFCLGFVLKTLKSSALSKFENDLAILQNYNKFENIAILKYIKYMPFCYNEFTVITFGMHIVYDLYRIITVTLNMSFSLKV